MVWESWNSAWVVPLTNKPGATAEFQVLLVKIWICVPVQAEV